MKIETNPEFKPLTRLLSLLAAALIVIMPFHAFLTVWASSIFGHYTALRLWKEFILTLLLLGCLGLAVRRRQFAWPRRQILPQLIPAYIILLVAVGVIALSIGTVSDKALTYGLLIDSRFLLFFCVVWYISSFDDLLVRKWRQLLLIPAGIVAAFGLLQFFALPADFLKHFGYGPHTINAVETVDQKAGYQRIQSTLRGANPLGAYLVLIITALSALVVRARRRNRILKLLVLAAVFAVLALTFSRSAWLGTAGALGWLVVASVTSRRLRRLALIATCAAFFVLAVAGFTLRNNDTFQNTFFHTDEHSRSATSSNQGHLAAAKAGLRDIAHQPFGRGPGTAGPASVYNKQPARIAENYYLQIGQEAGLLGAGLFIAINIVLGRELWLRRGNLLPQVLLASLIGISVVNLLSHAWTDDTLSYIWWGLAGAAMTLKGADEY